MLPRRSLLGLGVLSVCAPWTSTALPRQRLPDEISWAAFYGQNAETDQLSSFRVIVLDPMYTGSVQALAEQGIVALAYISVGEVANTAPYFSRVNQSALLAENPNWPGSYIVDVRNPSWGDLLVEEVMPALLARGFTGFFLDTLDTPPHQETVDPRGNRGMTDAAVQLVRRMRRANRNAPILMNRGYVILPRLLDTVDAIVAESVITTYNFETRAYEWVEPEAVSRHLELLRPARERSQPMPIYSLDYWDPADVANTQLIYERERALGHAPYVATIMLDRLLPEPLS